MKVDDIEQLVGVPIAEDLAGFKDHLYEVVASEEATIREPVHRVASSGGKYLRPMIVLAMTRALGCGNQDRQAFNGAAAVECVHIGTLVHDDALDGALARRGIPTVSHVEGWERALLVGDYLMGRASELAAGLGPDAAAAVARSVADIAVGQAQEEAMRLDLERSEGQILATIGNKTASLLGATAEVGACVTGLGEQERLAARAFGQDFGFSFQLVDDVLDIVSTDELMGKPTENDMASGVYTLPIANTLADGGPDSVRLRASLESQDHNAAYEIVRSAAWLKPVIEQARLHAVAAASRFAPFPSMAELSGLADLPLAYMEWALETLVPAKRRSLVGI